MGWRDREYSSEFDELHTPTSRLGIRRPAGGTLALMILHGAAFILMKMLEGSDGAFAVALCTLGAGDFHPLAVFLHPLASVRLFSSLFVVLALWSLGGRLEPRLGLPRFLTVYVAGNLAAGITYFALGRPIPALATAPLDYPVGALAGLTFVAWQRLQHDEVQVFGKLTSVAKMYAVCAAIVVGLALLADGAGAIAWIVAAGAGAGAAALVQRWSFSVALPTHHQRRIVRPSIPKRPSPPAEAPDVDDILAKISREGLAALTDAERQRLEAARQAKLRNSV